MKLGDVKVGLEVRTNDELSTTTGMTVHERHLEARVPSTDGVVTGHVTGHGGDVFWVVHSNNQIAAYAFTEFSPLKDAQMPTPPSKA